jgi:hypothetical protein
MAPPLTRPPYELPGARALRDRIPSPERTMAQELIRQVRQLSITAAPPAHIRPTVWSDPVDKVVTTTVLAAVGPYTSAVEFLVPPGRGCRIEQFGVSVQDAAYTYDGSILWAFRKNNSQYLDQGLSDWGEQKGSIVFPRKTVIVLDEGDLIQMMVRRAVVAGAPQTVQMGFRGWTWRKRNNLTGTQSSVTAY